MAGTENAVTEYLGKLILGAKMKYFFGKIMVPECTCGKLMLPGVAILWVKLQFWFFTIKLEPYLRMKADPRAGIHPDGKDVLQECTWPPWMDGG